MLASLEFLLGFLFPIMVISYSGVVLFSFLLFCVFFIHDEYVIGLEILFPIKSILWWLFFGNPDIMGNVLGNFFA